MEPKRFALIVSVLILLSACVHTTTTTEPSVVDVSTHQGGALGEYCDSETPCSPGLGCSGLYFSTNGTCIPEPEAKQRCAVLNGTWGNYGLRYWPYCMRQLADAGKPCNDSSECTGACIHRERGGECQRLESQFGCFGVMENGTPQPDICVD